MGNTTKNAKSVKKATEKSYEKYYNEPVPVMLVKDNAKYKDDVTVTVTVPRKVALVLERSRMQEAEAQAFMDSLKG